MRINVNRCQGSALLTALVIVGVSSLALGSYLKLVNFERLAMARSLAWNSALAPAESGIEEALTQIAANGTNVTANNGWTLAGPYLTKSRTSAADRWAVCMSTSQPPVILAQGFVRAPLQADTWVSRSVRVRMAAKSVFYWGLLGQSSINLNGNKIMADSYDSSTSAGSTDGLYDVTKRRSNTFVGTNSSIDDALNVGNADIWGEVGTGAGAKIALGSNGSIGDMTWHESGTQGSQPGAVRDDMNIAFEDVEAPAACSYAFAPAPETVNGTNYNYVLRDGYFRLSGSQSFTGKVLVTGHAVLLVTSDVSFSGQDYIYIAPGGSLDLYVGCPNASFTGQGIVSSRPKDFSYFGLSTNTSIKIAGNSDIAMAIYAPKAALSLNGGGSTAMDFCGSATVNSITLNGSVNFHFDEDLGKHRTDEWIAIGWEEVHASVADVIGKALDINSL